MASALCFVAAAPCAAASCSVESSTTTASTGLRRGLHSARVAAVVQPARSLSCGSSLAGTALHSRVCNKSVRPAGVESGTAAAVVRAVAAERVVEALEPSQTSTDQKTKYYFLIANAKFMLDDEEHFQELMQERLRNFSERNKEQNFWLAIEPKFLDKFPDIARRLNRPAVALVSTDKVWITFMKLRMDRVLRGEYEADTLKEALASNPVELKFEKPQVWKAPYPKYEGEWWTPFLLKEAEQTAS
jgi:hypothetical protein